MGDRGLGEGRRTLIINMLFFSLLIFSLRIESFNLGRQERDSKIACHLITKNSQHKYNTHGVYIIYIYI